MPSSTRETVRTKGYVLRRTNYGEADRILNIITPIGKVSAIAKSARKEKSKLAGGIEMFSLVDINLHKGKSDLWTVTGAKMLDHYSNLVKDFQSMELAALILKKVNAAAEGTDNAELFEITHQSLYELNRGALAGLVEAWFLINLKRVMGEEVNLYRDINGEKLASEKRYEWNVGESGFEEKNGGDYGADEIKLLRIMSSSKLAVVRRVKADDIAWERVFNFVKMVV